MPCVKARHAERAYYKLRRSWSVGSEVLEVFEETRPLGLLAVEADGLDGPAPGAVAAGRIATAAAEPRRWLRSPRDGRRFLGCQSGCAPTHGGIEDVLGTRL